jgi:hypothetical protein
MRYPLVSCLALAVAALAALTSSGCGSKLADCNNFAQIANTNVNELKAADPKDPKALHAAVKKVADAAKGIRVKDPGLAPMVKEYAAVWERGAAAAANLETTDDAVATKAVADINNVEKEESAIVDKINAYCK